MEKIIVTIFMGLLASFSGNAQSQYELKMTEALELWDAQKAPEAAALFEEIATAEEDNWLPYYYAAQVKVIDAFSQTSSAVKEKQLQEAQKPKPKDLDTLGVDPDDYYVRVGDTDVEAAIREPRVTAVVSNIARVPEVRAWMVQLFRDVIASGTRPGVITEGRDITTVVAPDAPVRILLTASEEARMARRAAEIVGQSAQDVGREMTSRDNQDSRVIDFMNAADGVTTIDSTNLDFDATIQAVVDLIRKNAH